MGNTGIYPTSAASIEGEIMFYKVKSVIPLDEYVLLIEFENGEKKNYDLKILFEKWPIFNELKMGNLFKTVKVDIGGFAVIWNDEIDISCNELWKMDRRDMRCQTPECVTKAIRVNKHGSLMGNHEASVLLCVKSMFNV